MLGLADVAGATCNPHDVSLVWLVVSVLGAIGVLDKLLGSGPEVARVQLEVHVDMATLCVGVPALHVWAPYIY